MSIAVYKNILSNSLMFVEIPKPEKKIRAISIGIMSNELGFKYPRIYDIPVAVSERVYEKIKMRKYWDSYFSDVFDLDPYDKRAALVASGMISPDIGEDLITSGELTCVYKMHSKVMDEKDLAVNRIFKDSIRKELGSPQGFVKRLANIAKEPGRELVELSMNEGCAFKMKEKEDVVCDAAIVLQRVRIDNTPAEEFAGNTSNVRRTFLERGDTVLILSRGPYRPVIQPFNDVDSGFQDMKLYTNVDVSRDDFIKVLVDQQEVPR